MGAPNQHKLLYVVRSRRVGDWDRYDQHFWRATETEHGSLEVKHGPNKDDYDVTVYAQGQWIRYEAKG